MYYCCDANENTPRCNPTYPENVLFEGKVTCSNTLYSEGLTKYRFCPLASLEICRNSNVKIKLSSLKNTISDTIHITNLPPGNICPYSLEFEDSADYKNFIEI